MKTIAPVDGENRSAREIADIVLDRLAKFVPFDAMARVELRNTLRPVKRESEAILRREAQEFCWWLQVFTRGDILITPGERRIETGSTDVRSLFDEFVSERSYEPAFATAFTKRGHRALDDAIRALESSAPEDGAA